LSLRKQKVTLVVSEISEGEVNNSQVYQPSSSGDQAQKEHLESKSIVTFDGSAQNKSLVMITE
jgi:hypothetical protein